MTDKEKIHELAVALQTARALISGFHTINGLKVWASTENRQNKALALEVIDEALELV